MPLPKFLPFDVLQGLVQVADAQDLEDLREFKRELRLGYREIDQSVRCITPGEEQDIPANCEIVDLEGDRKFFELIQKSNGERIGGLVLNVIHIENQSARKIEFSAMPTPAMDARGARIWGRTNTLQWFRSVASLLREMLDVTMVSDQGHMMVITGWLFPPRIKQHVEADDGDWKALSDLDRTTERVEDKDRTVLRRARGEADGRIR